MDVPAIFGSSVFNEKAMTEFLPEKTFNQLKETMKNGTALDLELANVVAKGMKEWAIKQGATHYTHWFQPLTGVTAEKHDSFITPDGMGGVLMEFSGKELVKGEPDASSFPNGGIRATFEARGYTAWDPSSYAFVKDHSLCIPTAFCSYNGEALDKKTPLLRSMEALNQQSLRILKLFGSNATHVYSTMGAEQEYFLVDEKLFNQRKDLIMTGRTLFGAPPVKGQEMDDQYFAAIKPRIVKYMEELNTELWKLGILAKTEHNEAAPAQHEIAPIFTTSNLAADQNQLTMEIMKKVARKHGMVCLLHEKPFEGVNGSGKHNNWSLSTNEGENIFSPGTSPRENAQFLLFLAAVIKAVDDNQDLLRICVASAGNDHRLGGCEAPPAIMSIYMGDELSAVLESIKDGKAYDGTGKKTMRIGADVLPSIPKDSTDRNRTSPFAFTGNRFEFRSVGSNLSISGPNTTLNAILADTLKKFADELEKSTNFDEDLEKLIKREITQHYRILFNGNGYASEWVKEAEKRGLKNYPTLPDAVAHYLDEKNIKLYTGMNIYSEGEMESHYEVKIEKYCKMLNIEVLTMKDMIFKDIIPASMKYQRDLAKTVNHSSLAYFFSSDAFAKISKQLRKLTDELYKKVICLDELHAEAKSRPALMETAHMYADKIIPCMAEIRSIADKMEVLFGAEYMPYPNYSQLLFSTGGKVPD
ncbi:MAG: glutamine synthetase III [Treponema sp.]|nr:glutamine synthetase III [Treponema sp.]